MNKQHLPNVLLLVLDSTRVQNTSLYGYERNTTPFLQDFTSRATQYTQARSSGINSIASHVSIFTGYHVEEHQATSHAARINPETTIWSELENEHGYETGLFTSNPVVARSSNLSNCFTYNHDPFKKKLFTEAYGPTDTNEASGVLENAQRCLSDDRPTRSLLNCAYHGIDKLSEELNVSQDPHTVHGRDMADEFLSWEQTQSDPWSVCINFMDTHFPYVAENEFDKWGGDAVKKIQSDFELHRKLISDESGEGTWETLEKLEDLYDGSILQVDAVLKNLINGLEEQNSLENTLVIITSDHGEAFGEQSRIDPDVRIGYHRYGLHEVLTHVPLIVKHPADEQQRVVTDEPVLSSTYRMKPGSTDQDKHIGPWRAVYENSGESVKKFANKRDKHATIDIHSPQNVTVSSRDPHNKVESAFKSLKDQKIHIGDQNISSEVKDHLRELGYVQ